MKIIITENYEAMSDLALHIVMGEMLADRRVNLSLTAGSTPRLLFQKLIEKLKGSEDYRHVHYYNFDEVGLKDQKYGLTMSALKQLYYDPAEIMQEQLHVLTCENAEGYDEVLKQDGGLDLVVMGLGGDGHFCANMPGTTDFSKEVYGYSFGEDSEFAELIKKETGGLEATGQIVTFGPRTVLKAKKILMFVNGKAKAEAVRYLVEGPITEKLPASILKLHHSFVLILDKDAASLLG